MLSQHELLLAIGQKLSLDKLEVLRGRFVQSIEVPARPPPPASGLRRVLYQAQASTGSQHQRHRHKHYKQAHKVGRPGKLVDPQGKQSREGGQAQPIASCSTMYATVFVALGYAGPPAVASANRNAEERETRQVYVALTQDQFVLALRDLIQPMSPDQASRSELAAGQTACSQLDLARAFRVLDADGSGKVSWDTFATQIVLSGYDSAGENVAGVKAANDGAADESEEGVVKDVSSSLFELCAHDAPGISNALAANPRRVNTVALSCASEVDVTDCVAGCTRSGTGVSGAASIGTPVVGPVLCSGALVVQAESSGPPLAWAWDRTVRQNDARALALLGKLDRHSTATTVPQGGHASVVTAVAVMLRSRRVAVATIGAGVEFYDFDLRWKSPVVPDVQARGKYLWAGHHALGTKSRVAATNAVGSTQHNPVLKRQSPLVLHYQPLAVSSHIQPKHGEHARSSSEQAWEELLLVGDDGGNVHVYTFRAVNHKDNARVSLSDGGSASRVWSFSDPKSFRLRVLRNHSDRVTALALIGESEDGWVVSASLDGTVKVFDLAQNRLRCTFDNHQSALHPSGPPRLRSAGGVYSAVWCKEAKLIASSGRDKGVLLWSPFARSKPLKLTGCGTVTQLSYIQGRALGPAQSHPHLYGLLCTLGLDARVLIYDLCHTRVLQEIEPAQMMRCPNERHSGDDGGVDNSAGLVQPVGCANRVEPSPAADVSTMAWDNARRRLIIATREGLRVWKWAQTKDQVGGSRHREQEQQRQSPQACADVADQSKNEDSNASEHATPRMPSTARQRGTGPSSRGAQALDIVLQSAADDPTSSDPLAAPSKKWKSGQHVLLWLDRETDAPLLHAQQKALEAEGKGAEFAALVTARVNRMRAVPAIVVGTDRHKMTGDERWIRVRYQRWAKRSGAGVQHSAVVRSVPSGALSAGGVTQTARLREADRHFRAPLPIALDSRFAQNERAAGAATASSYSAKVSSAANHNVNTVSRPTRRPKFAKDTPHGGWPFSNMREHFQQRRDVRAVQALDASPGSIGADLARIEHLEHLLAVGMAEMAAERTRASPPKQKVPADRKHAPRPPGTRRRSRTPRQASQRRLSRRAV